MGITRAATKTTITGFKVQSTATGGGISNRISYLADTALTGNVEENVIFSGVTNGNCFMTAEGASRHSLEDTTKNFDGTTINAMLLENSDDPTFGINDGNDNLGDNLRAAFDQFDPGDNYRVHGFAKASPTDYTISHQWCLLWIYGGTGVDQVRLISSVTDVGGEVRFWTRTPWETTPDATSTYRILWSPLDVVYANAAAGTITFDSRSGTKPLMVEMLDEILWGNVGGTTTGFGWADLVMTLDSSGQAYPPSYDTVHEFYSNVYFFAGEVSPIGGATGFPGMFSQWKTRGYAGGLLSPVSGSGADPDKRVYASRAWGTFGLGSFGGYVKEALFTYGEYGRNRSLHNSVLKAMPQSLDAQLDLFTFAGGNWGEPFNQFGAADANYVVTRITGRPSRVPPPEGRGLGWHGNNTGDGGTYYVWMEDCDSGIVGSYQDSASRDIDFHKFDLGFTFQFFIVKTLKIKVIDEQGNPIQNAVVEIKDRLGNVISYEDSGVTINESVDSSETVIDLSTTTGLTVGDVVRVDCEFMTIGTLTPGGPSMTVTRQSRLPLYFPASPHENATDGYDPKVYIAKQILTDVNGEVPVQRLFRSNCRSTGVTSSGRSEVISGGTNYRVKIGQAHTAAPANQPPNATYWDAAGSDGIPWEAGKRYTDGATFTDRSYSDFFPWTISVKADRFVGTELVVEPGFDSEGEVALLKLASLPIEIDQERVI